MHSTTLFAVSLFVIVNALPSTVSARPRCTGVFAKSCLKQLFRCFTPAGSCTTETEVSSDFLQTSVTTCWENGAATVSTFDVQTRTGTLAVTNAKGKVCAMATVVSTETGVESTYVRKRRSWIISTAGDGALTVTCPNRKVETYSVEDLAGAQPGCTGRAGAACQTGSCP
jgi:hypothetical protein